MKINNVRPSSNKADLITLVNKVYSNKKYPGDRNRAVGIKDACLLVKNIAHCLEANIELMDCPECDHSFTIGISDSKNVPLIPEYAKGGKERAAWIGKYGKGHYQMYLSISRLGKFAMFYWTKYGYSLFERGERRYQSPDDDWQLIASLVTDALSKMDIALVPQSVFIETVEVDYQGKIAGVDRHPSILKLLFGEELH